MKKQTGDERVIPSGWPGQCGGGSSRLGFVRGLLLGGVVVGHGVDTGQVVEAEANGVGDGSGAVASRRSPKTLLPFSRTGSRTTGFRRHLLSRPTVHAVVGMGSPEAAQREEQ